MASQIKPLKFLKEVRKELERVSWPSRQTTAKMTTIVIVASLLVAFYIGGLDFLFTKAVGFVIK